MLKKLIITILALILLIAGVYYFFFYDKPTPNTVIINPDGTTSTSFSPFNRNGTGTQPTSNPDSINPAATTTGEMFGNQPYKIPKLRKLSLTPVSGMSASTTASSSLVRFMDRGTGHVYEADDLSGEIRKISNTTLPKIYESYWNKNLTATVVRYLKEDTDVVTNFYAELRSTGTSTSETPYELKGKFLSPAIDQVAVAPAGDRIFTWNIENGRGAGYISSLNEDKKIKIADLPFTQVVTDWPETNVVTVSTKPSALAMGYMYAIDTKTGIMRKTVGGLRGLFGKESRDLSRTIFSYTSNNSFLVSMLNNKAGTSEEVIFKTLADKCVWSNLRKNELYCAVPTEIPSGLYPDDWYRGNVSFIDQIWYLDAATGEVHLLANLLNLSDELIDATQLTLDPKENYLYFINKRDLTLWMLDLNQ